MNMVQSYSPRERARSQWGLSVMATVVRGGARTRSIDSCNWVSMSDIVRS